MSEGNGNDDKGERAASTATDEERGPSTVRSSDLPPSDPAASVRTKLALLEGFLANIAAEQKRSFDRLDRGLRTAQERNDINSSRLREHSTELRALARTIEAQTQSTMGALLGMREAFERLRREGEEHAELLGKIAASVSHLVRRDEEQARLIHDVAEETTKIGRATLASVTDKALAFERLASENLQDAVRDRREQTKELRVDKLDSRKRWRAVAAAALLAFLSGLFGWIFGNQQKVVVPVEKSGEERRP